eukprot:CAMPEP_0197032486 /NCGR_PEP_ID=MMETSP1384-20130603/11155_1 /TAXON_ID=29189 /ORGANISM="Ammonia sp." /LENGTH=579 /DNA_ID=CAMNT_0042462159 /DNA_START=1 /DNA_END=1740 /DNA_ORIENTATION=+
MAQEYEEDVPPAAFAIESNPESIHIPTNSIMSVEAEVLAEPKKKPNVDSGDMDNMVFPMNNMMMNPMMMMNQMMLFNQFNNAMKPNQNNNQHNNPHQQNNNNNNVNNNNNNMQFQQMMLPQEFMDNMLNMAANMDQKNKNNANNNNANNNMSMARQSKPNNLSPYSQNAPRNNNNNSVHVNVNSGNQQNKNAHAFNIPPPQPNHIKMKSLPNQFIHNNMYNNNSHLNQAHDQQPYQVQLDAVNQPNNANVMAADDDAKQDKARKAKARPDPRDDPSVHGASEVDPNEFESPIEAELVSMGFERQYVTRACNLYRKKFKNKPLRLEVLTEIIIRLQQRDRDKYRHRAKSIESVDSEHKRRNKAMQSINQAIAPDFKRRSSFQAGVNNMMISDEPQYGYPSHDNYNVNNHHNQNHNNFGYAANGGPALQQSISHQSYAYNDYQPQPPPQQQQQQQQQQQPQEPAVVSFNRDVNQNANQQDVESVTVEIVMIRSSIGAQECEIVIRKDQTFEELKQLVSTCLTDFDATDDCYAFFHEHTGFVFDDWDMMIFQALQLMDVDVEAKNLHVTLKIARSVAKYIKK